MKKQPFFYRMGIPCFILILMSLSACENKAPEPVSQVRATPTPITRNEQQPANLQPTRTPSKPPVNPSPTQGVASESEPPSGGGADTTDSGQEASLPIDFKRELYTGWGGGGGICWGPNSGTLPGISVDSWGWPVPTRLATICLYGFAPGERVTVEVHNGLGHLVGSKFFSIEEGSGEDVAPNQTLVEGIPVSLPLNQNLAEWRIVASAPSGSAQTSLFVGTRNQSNQSLNPFLTVDHAPHTESYNPLDPQWMAPFQPGDVAWIQGHYFPRDTDLSLGIYRGIGQLEYVDDLEVRTDSQGAFTTQIFVQTSLPSGDYAVIPITFTSVEDHYVSDQNFGRFKIQAEEASLFYCDNPHWSQLTAGGRAYLADKTTSNLRSVPGLDEAVTGSLRPGEEVFLLEGPRCEDDYIWWFVHVVNSGLLGWTVEGDDENAWLVALP